MDAPRRDGRCLRPCMKMASLSPSGLRPAARESYPVDRCAWTTCLQLPSPRGPGIDNANCSQSASATRPHGQFRHHRLAGKRPRDVRQGLLVSATALGCLSRSAGYLRIGERLEYFFPTTGCRRRRESVPLLRRTCERSTKPIESLAGLTELGKQAALTEFGVTLRGTRSVASVSSAHAGRPRPSGALELLPSEVL